MKSKHHSRYHKTGLGTAWAAAAVAILATHGCTEKPGGQNEGNQHKATDPAPQKFSGAYPQAFARLPVWDDGLSEMCYYDATDTLYDKPRRYCRVMLLNREWLHAEQRVKAEQPVKAGNPVTTRPTASAARQTPDIPVFKLNIIEEIPTENYNYRFMVTVFLNRESLRPEKLAASSQEWCGTTFKQLQWRPIGMTIRGYSYFQGEADREWTLPAEPPAYPEEALFLVARAAVAANHDLDLQLLPSQRSNHLADPILKTVRLTVSGDTQSIRIPLGRFQAKYVTLADQADQELARFAVENDPPHRLLSYRSAKGLELSLRFVERRAYWDRSKPSRFYRQGGAP